MSKIFSVKSNAVRTAVSLGMTREAAYAVLEAVSGGWRFPLPGQDAPPASQEAPPVAQVESALGVDPDEAASMTPGCWREETDPNEPDVPDARLAHTIINGKTCGTSPTVEVLAPVEPVPAPEAAKAPRARKAKPAKPAKVAKAPKPAKVAKAKVAKAPKPAKVAKAPLAKWGTPEHKEAMAARRTSQGRSGITDEVISMLKRSWCSADSLMERTGWVSNTLRGVLSLQSKKHGFTIKRRKLDGATQYRIDTAA